MTRNRATNAIVRPHVRGSASLERSIVDLMSPASLYPSICEDEPVQRVIELLLRSLFHAAPGKLAETGRRTVLVHRREGAFLGCIRLNDILAVLAPRPRRETFAECLPGMFAARSKLLSGLTAGEILGEQRFVDVAAPLMEAVTLMLVDGILDIPVIDEGELVGMLTDRSFLLEIRDLVSGRGDRSCAALPSTAPYRLVQSAAPIGAVE